MVGGENVRGNKTLGRGGEGMVPYRGSKVTTYITWSNYILSKYCQLEFWNYFLFLLVVQYEAGAYKKKESQGIH